MFDLTVDFDLLLCTTTLLMTKSIDSAILNITRTNQQTFLISVRIEKRIPGNENQGFHCTVKNKYNYT